MSCAEWPRLRPWVARRLESGAGDEPTSVAAAATEHLAGCAECARRAYALDPSLLFLALREPSGVEAAASGEIAAMRAGVAAMRAVRASQWAGGWGRGRRLHAWRWAATALLVAASLVLSGHPAGLGPPARDLAAAAPAAAPPEVDLLPVVEELGRPEARVYQFAGDDLSVVMIVDETLDV